MTTKQSWTDRARHLAALSLVMAAATDEARRLGHNVVDTDHLLLGLIATGGASSRALADRGVTLARAREALVDVQRSDLAIIGIEAPDMTLPPPQRCGGGEDLDITERVQDAWAGEPLHGTDLSLLRVLLADADGPAVRVLARLGVEPDAIDVDAEASRAADPEPAADDAWDATYTMVTDVSLERIWALLDDPAQRPRWDSTVSSAEATDGGFVGICTDDDGTRLERIMQRMLPRVRGFTEERTPPTTIQWRLVHGGRLGTTQRLRIELTPERSGTRITLRIVDLSGRGRRIRRVVGDFSLRHRAQSLVQAASS